MKICSLTWLFGFAFVISSPASADVLIDDFGSPAEQDSAAVSTGGTVFATQESSSAVGGYRRYVAELSSGATGTLVSGFSGAGQFGYFSLDGYNKGTSTFSSSVLMEWGGSVAGSQLNLDLNQLVGPTFSFNLEVDTFEHLGLSSVDLVLYVGATSSWGAFEIQSVPLTLTNAGTAVWDSSAFTGVNFGDVDYLALSVDEAFPTGSSMRVEFSNFSIVAVPEPASAVLGGLGEGLPS